MIFQLMLHADENVQHFCAVLRGDALHKFKKNRLPVKRFLGRKSLFFSPLHIWQIIQLCRKQNITLLHAHHRYFDFIGSIAAKILKIPLVTSVQYKAFNKKVFGYKADILVVPGKSIQNHLVNYFQIPPQKVRLINNFITPEDLHVNTIAEREEFLSEYKIPQDRTILLYAGRLSKEKGIDVLLKAMRTIMREYSDLFLLIAGDGDQKKQVRNYCESKLSNFAIVGSQENISPCYELADIVILPSRSEPFPLTILETGLYKKPIIASAVDGILEIVDHGENGLLFAKDDKQELAAALRMLLEDATLRVKYGNNLHKKVTTELLYQNKIPEYRALYNELHKSKPER